MAAEHVERSWFSSLNLTDFRSYESLSLDLSDRHVVLIGNNGAGKTNILEAVSLLYPGRGIRRAAYGEVARKNGSGNWSVAGSLVNSTGANQIGSGFVSASIHDQEKKFRQYRINGATVRSAEELTELIRILWITPAMDRLFTGPASDRRRFLDRMVLAIDPQHGRRVSQFEKAMRSRNRLLLERPDDSSWLEGLEVQIAEFGVAVSYARNELVSFLTGIAESEKTDSSVFPSARLSLDGEFENVIRGMTATDAEDIYRESLRVYRPRDSAAGRLLTGPHLTDLQVIHFEKNTNAGQSSTGEQKSLLIGLVLAHAKLVSSMAGAPPILLLDEIAAHLDSTRRISLYDQLENLGSQCWMSGTEEAYFEPLGARAQTLLVKDGTVVESSEIA